MIPDSVALLGAIACLIAICVILFPPPSNPE